MPISLPTSPLSSPCKSKSWFWTSICTDQNEAEKKKAFLKKWSFSKVYHFIISSLSLLTFDRNWSKNSAQQDKKSRKLILIDSESCHIKLTIMLTDNRRLTQKEENMCVLWANNIWFDKILLLYLRWCALCSVTQLGIPYYNQSNLDCDHPKSDLAG